MNYQKILIATLGGAVVFFFAGWIIWGMALAGTRAAHMTHYDGLMKPEGETQSFILIAVAMIVTALLYAIIYNRWAGIKTFATGAKAGAVIAVLAGLSSGIMSMAMMNLLDWTLVGIDVVGNLIWGALGGGAIGWILGRGDD